MRSQGAHPRAHGHEDAVTLAGSRKPAPATRHTTPSRRPLPLSPPQRTGEGPHSPHQGREPRGRRHWPTACPRGPPTAGSPCGEGAAVCGVAWACRRSSAVWLFLGLRSGFAVLIFLGRPRFRPAIFRPFLLSFFFRALEGDGFLMVVAPAFSSSAPESWQMGAGPSGEHWRAHRAP